MIADLFSSKHSFHDVDEREKINKKGVTSCPAEENLMRGVKEWHAEGIASNEYYLKVWNLEQKHNVNMTDKKKTFFDDFKILNKKLLPYQTWLYGKLAKLS